MENPGRLAYYAATDGVIEAPTSAAEDMSILALHLLRRVAVAALLLTVALAGASVLVREFRARPEETIARASRALDVARAYGAGAQMAAYRSAEGDLATARGFVQSGQPREARRAAARAEAHAIEAQRTALTQATEVRLRAQAAAEGIDREMNALETLYSQITPALDKASVAHLLSIMKAARQAGGGVVLAYEQGDYQAALAKEPAARESLRLTREALLSARR